MTYYYAVYHDEYFGFGKIHKTTSLNTARANLVKELRSINGEGGVVATIPNMEILPELDGFDRRTVGIINTRAGPVVNGKFTKDYYVWYNPATNKEYLVNPNGSISPYAGRDSIVKARSEKTVKKKKR